MKDSPSKIVYHAPRKVHIRPIDYLLIIGIVVSPMTGLRLGQIGPGEVLVSCWCFATLFEKKTKPRSLVSSLIPTTIFWILFLAMVFAGTIIGISNVPTEVILSHLITWIYFAVISIAAVHALLGLNLSSLKWLLYRIGQVTVLWNLLLYLFSILVQPTFLGAPIWYAGVRFSGGGTNPHQVSLLLGAAVVILAWSIFDEPVQQSNFSTVVLMAIGIFLCLQTQSSTLYLSLIIAVPVAIISWLVANVVPKQYRALTLIFFSLTAGIATPTILGALQTFVESDPNGPGRIELWTELPRVIEISPLFGLGPGTHSYGGTAEFHNTYIEVFAMAGLLGLAIFLAYHVYVANSVRNEPMLLSLLSVLATYGFAGFAARRLPFWILFAMILVIGLKSRWSHLSDEKQTSGLARKSWTDS